MEIRNLPGNRSRVLGACESSLLVASGFSVEWKQGQRLTVNSEQRCWGLRRGEGWEMQLVSRQHRGPRGDVWLGI